VPYKTTFFLSKILTLTIYLFVIKYQHCTLPNINLIHKFYDLEIVAVLDSDNNKIGKCINGYIVNSPLYLNEIKYDFIILLIVDYINLIQGT